MSARVSFACVVALVTAGTSACSRQPCEDAAPSLLFEVRTPSGLEGGPITSLRVELEAGDRGWSRSFPITNEFDDGRTELVVEVEPAPTAAFDVRVSVTAFSESGGSARALASATNAFNASADGCNATVLELSAPKAEDGGVADGSDAANADAADMDASDPEGGIADIDAGPDPCDSCPVCTTCDQTRTCVATPNDDPRCGPINCDGFDSECRDYQDLVTNRCAELGVCQTATATSCVVYADLDLDPCSDGDLCTEGDTCGGGVCSGNGICPSVSDRTAETGLADDGLGYGYCWADFDEDGHLDMYSGATGFLYRNDGLGVFTVTLDSQAGFRGCNFADADNDGDLDLFITGGGGRFFENDGSGTFTERGVAAGLSPVSNLGTSVWLDFDADGDLDLFTPNGAAPFNQIKQNNGDVPVTFTALLGPDIGLSPPDSNGETCTAADFDDDGDLDVWYNDALSGSLYVNDGDGTFTAGAAAAGLAIDMGLVQPYYAPVFADYDNDGRLDLFLGHPAGVANRLYRNDGNGTFTLAPALADDLGDSRGASFGDFDHDGDLDLLIANEGTPDALYRNNGDGTFTDVAVALGIAGTVEPSVGASMVDYDGDGDLDLYLGRDGAPNVLWQNQLDDDKFLRVYAVGRGAGFSPRDGIGARIELRSADDSTLLAAREISGGEGYGAQPPRYAHFGLAAAWGGAHIAYTVRVRFPSGLVVTRGGVQPSAEAITIGARTMPNTIEVFE